jgi:RNA polymerase II subunit A small phosphatase-like protein
MILVFDLDETLIHSHEKHVSGPDVFRMDEYYVQRRPYLDQFLSMLKGDPDYQFGVWSAGSYSYVHDIVKNIFPNDNKPLFVLTRNDCNELRDKPLSKVLNLLYDAGNTNITSHEILIIDNKPDVTGHDHLRHLLIKDFEGDRKDIELKDLWNYLNVNRGFNAEDLAIHWQ